MGKYKYYVVCPANPGFPEGIYTDYNLTPAAMNGHPGDNGNRKGAYDIEEALQHYRERSGQVPLLVGWRNLVSPT